jgi:hypothetical protein
VLEFALHEYGLILDRGGTHANLARGKGLQLAVRVIITLWTLIIGDIWGHIPFKGVGIGVLETRYLQTHTVSSRGVIYWQCEVGPMKSIIYMRLGKI